MSHINASRMEVATTRAFQSYYLIDRCVIPFNEYGLNRKGYHWRFRGVKELVGLRG
ncbi:hypothetical protein [Microbulbifer sp. TRSA005]|uniref:hypothetical protein n=1 Tax=unclassified Microbulbifer TaxID=2619833 RepID=UPI0040391D34